MTRIFPRNAQPPTPLPSISPKDAYDLATRAGALIVDVREPDEWNEARIPRAKHIPLAQIAERHAEIPRDRPVVLQCRSGARSGRATQALLDLGFSNVRNLEGGITAWAASDLPLEHGAD